jgi:hypothetical protein
MTAEPVDPAKTIDAARDQIGQIDDPAAIPAILALLKTEKIGLFRRALIQPLIKLGGPEAVAALVKLSVEDENPTLRDEAAAGLAGKPELPQFLDEYVKYLHNPRHSSAAAKALRLTKLATRQSSAEPLDPKLTKALVGALVQKERKLVRYWTVFDTGPVPGLEQSTIDSITGPVIDRRAEYGRLGKRSARYIRNYQGWIEVFVPVPNPQALETLKIYTSQNLEYDQAAWTKTLNINKGK